MSRILLSSLRSSFTKITYGSLNVTSRLLLRTTLPNVSCYTVKENVASVSAKTWYNSVDEKIDQLDQHMKRVGRTTAKDIRHIIDDVKSIGSLTPTQALMLIRACGSLLVEEKPVYRNMLFQEIWKLIANLGVKLDISHYNALLRVYLENEYPFDPNEILSDIERKGIEPNRVTCQRLLTKYCQLGDVTNATRILEFMREKSMPINEAVFNSLILGYAQAKDMQSAEGILKLMKESGIEPSAATYTSLICGFIRNGNLNKLYELLQQCDELDISLQESYYFDIIYTLALNGYDEEVDKVLERIRKTPNYNLEAMNFTFKLLTVNKPEIGFKILKSMTKSSRPDGSIVPIGNFFISQLVRSDQPVEVILKYCEELINENMNSRALFIAMENCLRHIKEKPALELFKYAKELNIPIRCHYFWPLLINRGRQKDIEGMFEIISKMNYDFGLNLSLETVREYVVPFMMKSNMDIGKMLVDLRGSGVSVGVAVGSIVGHLLDTGKLKQAAEIVKNYPTSFIPRLLRLSLNNCFILTKDIDSYVTVLKDFAAYLHFSANALENNEETEYSAPDYREYVGSVVEYALKKLIGDRCVDVAENLIKALHENKVGISENKVESIKNILGKKLSSESVQLLEKLSSEDFAVPEKGNKSFRMSWHSMDEKSLERVYETMKANGEPTLFLKKFLYNVYCKNRNMEKALQMKDELMTDNFALTTGMKVYLIDVYVHHGKVDEAMEIFDSLCSIEPHFVLNTFKTLSLVELLIKTGQYDRGFELLKTKVDQYKCMEKTEDTRYQYNNIVMKILNTIAETGDAEKVEKFLNLLMSVNIVEPTNSMLGPLVKAHVKKGDYEAAFKEFENCVKIYKATPCKHELLHHCIETGNGDLLQKITDLATEVHGESNALSDVMLALSECGRLKEARKIMETAGVFLRKQRLEMVCNSYVKTDNVEHLRNLLEVTKGIPVIDRTVIYDSLLKVYDKSNDVENALGLWTEMQEEDLQPSEQFLLQLAENLKRNGATVPFIVPEDRQSSIRSDGAKGNFRRSPSGTQLRKFILNGDLDSALRLQQDGKLSNITNSEWAQFVSSLLKQGRYEEAKHIFKQSKETTKRLVDHNTTTILLKEAAVNGDVDIFRELDSDLNDNDKRIVHFNNTRAIAFGNAGKIEELVTELEQNLMKLNSKEEFSTFANVFPRSLIGNIMDNHPEYASRILDLVNKCIAMDKSNPTLPNILWAYHLIKKNYTEADKIWSEYLISADRIFFRHVISAIQKNVDVELCKKLITYCESNSAISTKALGLLYSHLIIALLRRNNVEEAVETFKTTSARVPIENFLRSSLHVLRSACLEKQMEFPYDIPEKYNQNLRDNNSDSNSDSDSATDE